MTPTAEPGDPSKTAGRRMIAEQTHPSLSKLQPPAGRNQPAKTEGEVDAGGRVRGGVKEGKKGRKMGQNRAKGLKGQKT